MKAKLALILITCLVACKDEETPTPIQQPPIKQPSNYFVQATAVNEIDKLKPIPFFVYVTDTIYQWEEKFVNEWPAPKLPVYGFKDSIDLYMNGAPRAKYALNIYYKDSLLATDTVDQWTHKKTRVKWRL